jgi:RHS repeat-associated protein
MTNSAGTTTWTIDARPFGDGATISGSSTLNLRFPGQYFDQETGFHQNWWREYDPSVGRYTQADPLKRILNTARLRASFCGVASARFGGLDPAGRTDAPNPYSYVAANPLMYIDPTGAVRWSCQIATATAGAGMGWLQLGVMTLGAFCTSECKDGKQMSVDLTGIGTGGSVGPLPAGGSVSTYDMVDSYTAPIALALEGYFAITSGITGALGPHGGSCAWAQLGAARSVGDACGPAAGLDLGSDFYSGAALRTHVKEQCCQ